ncbi:MAG: C39 family peptidase [Negativicutes bacterium]|nr:C39 family peptidase [Negativicutes bacterium]
MRRIIILVIMAALLAWGAAVSAGQPAERTVTMNGTLLLQTGSAFTAGSTEGTAVLPEETAPVRLAAKAGGYLGQGVYLSPVIQTVPFDALIVSWNADTPPGTAITVEAQVLVEKKWSDWFSWGVWGDKAASADNPFSWVARMDVDTLELKGGKKATAIRYRLKLSSHDPKTTPAVRLIALTIKNKDRSKEATATAVSGSFERDLTVPPYSQARRDPKIASRICSPTSLSMVMAYHGIQVAPETAAWGSYDTKRDLFGNWTFNAAYAARCGLTAYVAYLDSLTDLKLEIAQGYPVVAAVWYRSSEAVAQPLPVLHGAPIDYTEGHLVVVRGFKVRGGKEYVLVNDPAGADEAGVYREYLAAEFEAAWVKVAYIIRPGPGPAAPQRP